MALNFYKYLPQKKTPSGVKRKIYAKEVRVNMELTNRDNRQEIRKKGVCN